MPTLLGLLVAALTILVPGQSLATGLGAVCDAAARRAAAETGVPVSLLRAIALVESGRGQNGAFAPWPWAANIGGEPHYFESRNAALLVLADAVQTGTEQVDIGCFQLNHHWHGESFVSLQAMLDPAANARYAAEYLETLYDEFGSWDGAVGAYHSRDPERAEAYRGRVLAALDDLPARIPDAFEAPPLQAAPPRARLPLIAVGGNSNSPGSLMPVSGQAAVPLIAGVGR